MGVPTDLTHFKPSEFTHPEVMNVQFCRWLDRVRERAGIAMKLTSAGRTPSENANTSGSAKFSLHEIGMAVDMEDHYSAAERFKIAEAVICLKDEAPGHVELELVFGPTDHHLHLGVDPRSGKDHELVLALD